MSFGIAGDAAPPGERGGVLGHGAAQFCPYIRAFVGEATYEQWAGETPEAETMVLPFATAFALTESLGRRLTA